MENERVSLREFARRKGWQPSYVHKLKEAGRLVMDGGKVDVQASLGRLAESADPARAHLVRDQAPPAILPSDVGVSGGAPPLSHNATFNKARTASQVYDAKLRELDYRTKAGELIDVREASRLAFTAFRTLRDAVLNVPARVKDHLAAMTDPLAIEQLLDAEIGLALEQFRPEAVLREGADDETDDDADD